MNNSEKPAYAFTDGDTFKHDGLSKRERFAMAAMEGINSNHEFIENSFEEIADFAVEQADALLEELEKQDQQPL